MKDKKLAGPLPIFKKLTLSIFALSLIFLSANLSYAEPHNPMKILNQKYPNERVKIIKSADLNNDNKKEYFILTEAGNFYLLNSKGILVLINTGILSDDDADDPSIQIFSATKKEMHVAVSFNYFPSNTRMYVYRLQNGTLIEKLNIMGDLQVFIDSKSRVVEYWKKYFPEGGWEAAKAVYTWDPNKLKYKGSGQLP
ncbi:hypothetical protein [Paenibacillus sp. FSL K6-1566]|uniref:hypothetical protein n=1 Tax=Paenibacillus TaxID=44249 RepID=UPI0031011634